MYKRIREKEMEIERDRENEKEDCKKEHVQRRRWENWSGKKEGKKQAGQEKQELQTKRVDWKDKRRRANGQEEILRIQ